MGVRVILDCEIGNNIDDTFSLALAAVSPEIELLGVTTTQLRARERALIAERLLAGYGVSVPICAGYDPAYFHVPVMDLKRFGRLRSHGTLMATDATQWLIGVLKETPGITYVANAPLTNLAAVLTEEPGLAGAIDRVVMMGGWASTAIPESNILSDPEAGDTVIRSGIPITAMGYEVTLGCVMPRDWLNALRRSRLKGTGILMALTNQWFHATNLPEVILHDPLTVAYLCRPDLVELETVKVSIRCIGGDAKGSLYPDPEGGVPISVGVSCKKDEYLKFAIERLMGCEISADDSASGYGSAILPIRLTQAAEWFLPAGYLYRSQGQEFTRIIQILSGRLSVYDGHEKPHIFGPDSLVLLKHGFAGTVESEDGAFIRFADITEAGSGGKESPITDMLPGFLKDPLPSSVDRNMQMLVQSQKELGPHAVVMGMAGLWGLLYALMSEVQRKQKPVKELKDIIDQADGVGMDLRTLSEMAGMSKFQYIRAFKRHWNVTPARYGLHKRMEKAKELLESSDMSVEDIAQAAGYTTAAAFSRAFSREVGLSPTDYRRAFTM